MAKEQQNEQEQGQNKERPVIQLPQVLIGCGGTGGDMVKLIVRLWDRRQPYRIILIDTDSSALNNTRLELIADLKVPQDHITDFHLDNTLVQRALQDPEVLADDYMPILESGGIAYKDKNGRWVVDPDKKLDAIQRMANNEAAQQTPAFSRMTFMASRREVSVCIANAISGLLRQDEAELDAAQNRFGARVAVFGSSFGGTGAGIVLPVMYVVQDNFIDNDRVELTLWLFDDTFAGDSFFTPKNTFIQQAKINSIICERELDIVQQNLQILNYLPEQQASNDQKKPSTQIDQEKQSGPSEQNKQPARIVGSKPNTAEYLLPLLCESNNDRPAHYKYNQVYIFTRFTYGGSGRNLGFREAQNRVAKTFVDIIRLKQNNGTPALDNDFFDAGMRTHYCAVSGMMRNYRSASSSVLRYPRQKAIDYLSYVALADLCKKTLEVSALNAPPINITLNFSDYTGRISQGVHKLIDDYKRPETIKTFPIDEADRTVKGRSTEAINTLVQQFVRSLEKEIQVVKIGMQNAYEQSFAIGKENAKNVITALTTIINELQAQIKGIDSSLAKLTKDAADAKEEAEKGGLFSNKTEKRTVYLNALEKEVFARATANFLSSSKKILTNKAVEIQNDSQKYENKKGGIQELSERLEEEARKLLKRIEGFDEIQGTGNIFTVASLNAKKIDAKVLAGILEMDDLSEKLAGILTGDVRLPGVEGVDVKKANRNKMLVATQTYYKQTLPKSIVDYLSQLPNRVELIRHAYLSASPLFSCAAHHGITRLAPNSYCFCIAPRLPQGETQPVEFTSCFETTNLNIKMADGKGASIVSCSDDNEELVFVHILTGLRPNYETHFTDKKRVFLEQRKRDVIGITPLPMDKYDCYNEEEARRFGWDPVRRVGRDPESKSEL
ncbi:MAG: hypothetical protein IK077_16685 [Thermoguttaceae bacterium]|nr:hypothetical protein [Thermoguttaceae bacterium]